MKTFPREEIEITKLKAHPKNYRKHPKKQIDHIIASLKTNGQYRNVVIAKDGTILAGHGVVEAARYLKWTRIEVVRFPFGPQDPRSLKVMVGDNEIGNIAEDDDRELGRLLKSISKDGKLLGTGYDDNALDALLKSVDPKHVEFQVFDESAKDGVEFATCPKCKHKFAL